MSNPGGLTDTQYMNLFHCLEIPYSASYAAVDGMGAAYVQTANQPILSAAKSAIAAFVSAMEAVALTDLAGLLDSYNQFRSIEFSGTLSIGSIQGIQFSTAAQRQLIKTTVQDLVPYFRYHEIMEKQSGVSSDGISGLVIR